MFNKGIRQLYPSRHTVLKNQQAYAKSWRKALKCLTALKETACSDGYPRVGLAPMQGTFVRSFGVTKVVFLNPAEKARR